jgi:hypothetical protein
VGGASGTDTNNVNFGFTGPETYPIDNFIGQLRAADLDGDGLNDLIVVNNSRSKITILYNQTGKTNRSAATNRSVKRELNELPPDARFRIESMASEKRIAAFVVGDLNGDGRPDIAYYGEPKELVVQYNQGTNGWSSPKRWPIEDGQLTPNALAIGDLNGNGQADLILLGDNNLYLLRQTADHSLAEPEKIPYSGNVKSVQILDIDGDSREDLLLVNWEARTRFGSACRMPLASSAPKSISPCPRFGPTGRMISMAITRPRLSPSPRTPGGRRFRILSASRRRYCLAAFDKGNFRCYRSIRRPKRGAAWFGRMSTEISCPIC